MVIDHDGWKTRGLPDDCMPAMQLENATVAKDSLETQVAMIVDPTAYCIACQG